MSRPPSDTIIARTILGVYLEASARKRKSKRPALECRPGEPS